MCVGVVMVTNAVTTGKAFGVAEGSFKRYRTAAYTSPRGIAS
jgi:hypothetical protein